MIHRIEKQTDGLFCNTIFIPQSSSSFAVLTYLSVLCLLVFHLPDCLGSAATLPTTVIPFPLHFDSGIDMLHFMPSNCPKIAVQQTNRHTNFPTFLKIN